MTTIVADARVGIMVADSYINDSVAKWEEEKIYRLDDRLVGLAGTVRQCDLAFSWLRRGAKGRGPKGDWTAIVLGPEGVSSWSYLNGSMFHSKGFFAVGSGYLPALSLLEAGHTAEEAIHYTCLVDAQSGGKLQVQYLKEN